MFSVHKILQQQTDKHVPWPHVITMCMSHLLKSISPDWWVCRCCKEKQPTFKEPPEWLTCVASTTLARVQQHSTPKTEHNRWTLFILLCLFFLYGVLGEEYTANWSIDLKCNCYWMCTVEYGILDALFMDSLNMCVNQPMKQWPSKIRNLCNILHRSNYTIIIPVYYVSLQACEQWCLLLL